MYKILTLLRRKPGTSVEQFRAYYEGRHARLGEHFLKGRSTRYQRRYLTPVGHPTDGASAEGGYDCLTEMWFRDEAQWHEMIALLSAPGNGEQVIADEERFMDRAAMRMFTVEEHETDIG